jgi:hypothetical protein
MSGRERVPRPVLDGTSAIVSVTPGGRGFITESSFGPVVVTAAHNLPGLPPAHPAAYLEERTYENLLGLLGVENPSVWAECLFADPVGDLAVLGAPDSQTFDEQSDAYEALAEATGRLTVKVPDEGRVWLLSLEHKWFSAKAQCSQAGVLSYRGDEPTPRGMSGSPIIRCDGGAVGIVCGGDSSLNAILVQRLPGFLTMRGRGSDVSD